MTHITNNTEPNKEAIILNEKIYKTMKQVGAWNIAIGVTLIVLGVLSGVMTIVNGARLIKDKSNIMF